MVPSPGAGIKACADACDAEPKRSAATTPTRRETPACDRKGMSAMPSGLTRRLLLAFQLQLHRLIHRMAVVSWPPGHFDDDAELL